MHCKVQVNQLQRWFGCYWTHVGCIKECIVAACTVGLWVTGSALLPMALLVPEAAVVSCQTHASLWIMLPKGCGILPIVSVCSAIVAPAVSKGWGRRLPQYSAWSCPKRQACIAESSVMLQGVVLSSEATFRLPVCGTLCPLLLVHRALVHLLA
jgi:hypothetical protein